MNDERHSISKSNIGKTLTYHKKDGTVVSGTISKIEANRYIVEWDDSHLFSRWNPLRSPCTIKGAKQ